MWIGELIAARGEFQSAALFFSSARTKLEQVLPTKTYALSVLEVELQTHLGLHNLQRAERHGYLLQKQLWRLVLQHEGS